VPILVLAGEIEDQPRAVQGQVQVRPILPLNFSIDHRYVDAAQLGQALAALREYLTNPAAFEPLSKGNGALISGPSAERSTQSP
jgi:pyruvate/2-oxoglutarate dehydrogenase complex dihydrolipoamide acyltransferase (E2) component